MAERQDGPIPVALVTAKPKSTMNRAMDRNLNEFIATPGPLRGCGMQVVALMRGVVKDFST